MTKTSVTIIEGGFCQNCGKSAPPKATKRFKFCSDTCRQAAYRHRTGKSAHAGTIRLKAPIPLPAERGDCKYFVPGFVEREMTLIKAAFENQCRGVIEVYHRKYGRGVLDLLRPWSDSQNVPGTTSTPRQLYGGFWRLFASPYPNSRVWDTPRCRFKNKHWYYLTWRDIWLLEYHKELPGSLKWIHADPTRRVRKNRTVHIDFNVVGVEWDSGKECFRLVRQEREPSIVQHVMDDLTERDGRQHDDVSAQEIKLDDSDSSDDNGSDSTNERRR